MLMFGGSVIFLILVLLIVFILTSCIRIVPQAQALVVERLGAYLGTYGVGIHFMVPFIDRVAKKVNLKEQVEDFPPQPVITKDNVTMQIDTVVFFYITDPKSYAYGVERPILAIENLTATTLRNIIGELELDETLTSRETINAKMQESLDIATDPAHMDRFRYKLLLHPWCCRFSWLSVRSWQKVWSRQVLLKEDNMVQIIRSQRYFHLEHLLLLKDASFPARYGGLYFPGSHQSLL